MEQKTIKIFLASSEELHDERVAFGNFIRKLDKIYETRGMRVEVFEWEDFGVSITDRRVQDEYNEKVRESDMFVALFYKKARLYTLEEYNVAMEAYHTKKYPKVYVYFKTLNEGEVDTPELKAFKARLSENGYLWTNYSNQDQLRLHFIQQLLMVENSLDKLKYEDGTVTLDGMHVAYIANLPFAKYNKDYQRMNAELFTLPGEIEGVRQFLEEHPDNDDMRGELQKKLNRYNELKEEFARLQKTLFETSQCIAGMQREQLSYKLRRAAEAFEAGNMERANTLLDDIEREAETHYADIDHYRELVHQDIEAFLLRAKTRMAEVNTPIEERIKQVQAIYAKAEQWADDSKLPDEKYEGMLNDYSKFLYDYGLYKKAKPVYLRLISLREDLYGLDHPDTATSYNGIGMLYYHQGDYAKALEYHRRALDIFARRVGQDHPYTATSYNNIGRVYRKQGDYAKALMYNIKALDIRERVLGLDHPDTATSYSNIGVVYYSQGDYAKALEYYEKALDIRERVLGPDHPDTAQSYNNIGMVYHSQGDYAKALEYLGKALVIRERVLGPDHPDTATSYNNIGEVYYHQGDYAKALEYYKKALDIYGRVLDPDHPDTAGSYNNIGAIYDSQGDYPKALEYHRRALDIFERVLGPDHPYTASSYNNIGMVYRSQGNYAKALEYLRKALDIRERVLGPDHPNTATSYRNIGFVYDMIGDHPKALEWYDKSLNVRNHMLNKNADDTDDIDLINSNQNNDFKYVLSLKKILDETVRDNGYYHCETKEKRVSLCSHLLQIE